MTDQFFMQKALLQAMRAKDMLEVPVGAVLVKDDKIISRGFNRRETLQDATGHAEIIAIKKACNKLGSWRLSDCTLYVTLEPCPMCAGAIINARIPRVVVGAEDPKGGAFGGRIDLNSHGFNHMPTVEFGVLQQQCSQLLKDFFIELRNAKV